jgi:hypothetical protein
MATNCEAKTHVIDGVTCVEVDRKAQVGEKVIAVNYLGSECEPGDVLICTASGAYDDGSITASFKGDPDDEDEAFFGMDMGDKYLVLEPVKPTLDELLSKCTPENRHEEVFAEEPQLLDLLANLARRVTSLETQLRGTQNNLEKQAEELANARHRLAKHADRFAAIEDKVEMLTDDIVTLDSRSQVLNAINKYYAEGAR